MSTNEHNPMLDQAAVEQNEDGLTIDLVELFYRLIEKMKYIIAAALLGAVLAWAYTTYMVTPMYTTSSKLYVMNTSDAAINLSDFQMGNYLASDYKEVFNIWHVHEMVIDRLDLPYGYGQIAGMLSVSNPSDTRMLKLTVTSSDPQEAKAIADAYADVAKEFIATAMETEEPNVIEEALLPTSPSSPNKTRNILLGFLLGGVLAAGVITLLFITDDRVHTGEELTRYLGLPVLGMLPLQTGKKKGKHKHPYYGHYGRGPEDGNGEVSK